MNTLTQLFDWLLAASLRASLLTLIVVTAQTLLRSRLPASWLYALWCPVLAVLLMPVFPASPWSAASISHRFNAPIKQTAVIKKQTTLPEIRVIERTPKLQVPINWRCVLLFTWFSGAAGMLLVGAASFAITLQSYKRTRVSVSDTLLDEITRTAREIGLRRLPQVWMVPTVRGPAVTGLLHPILLLPRHFGETLTPQEMRFVLKHELTHIKRGDLPLNALLCVLLALHWFNPLLWFAFFKARLDREAACDAQVLGRENHAQRIVYGHMLLKIETTFSQNGLSLGFVGIFQRSAALRSRIQFIANQPKTNTNSTMKAILLFNIILLTFFGITKAAPPQKPDAPLVRIDAKFIELSEDSVSLLPVDVAAVSPSVSGVFTDEQFGAFLKKIDGAKGIAILSEPSVTTPSGHKAVFDSGREFSYKDADGKPLGNLLTLLPVISGKNQIDLTLTSRIVELEGGVERPVFTENKKSTVISLFSGQTIVLGVSPDPAATKTEKVNKRTLVFLTVSSVDSVTSKSVIQPGSPTAPSAKPREDWVDLTAQVAASVKNNTVSVDLTKAGENWPDDPAVGVDKKFRVEYSIDGVPGTKTCEEDQTLTITADKGTKLLITKALFGDLPEKQETYPPGSIAMADLTDLVKSLVKDNTLEINLSSDTFQSLPDPAVGVDKSFMLIYRVDDADGIKTCGEEGVIRLTAPAGKKITVLAALFGILPNQDVEDRNIPGVEVRP